jgi:hypothetical protein
MAKKNTQTLFIFVCRMFAPVWLQKCLVCYRVSPFLTALLVLLFMCVCVCCQGIGGSTGSVLGGNHPEIRIHAQVKGCVLLLLPL